jgi:hypothetical protein
MTKKDQCFGKPYLHLLVEALQLVAGLICLLSEHAPQKPTFRTPQQSSQSPNR